MIYYSLPFSIFTREQLKEVGKALDREDDIKDLAICRSILNKDTGECVDNASTEKMNDHILIGHEAIRFLVEQAGLDIKPVSEINIPYSVFEEINAKQWIGICVLESKVETQGNRYARLVKLNAPLIILLNEHRLTAERFESLESNYSKIRWKEDHTIIRSLNDIGFTMTTGEWMDWKQEELEEKYERLNEEEDANAED